jgi:mannose/fructose-specific phosphotransferase system component IIA
MIGILIVAHDHLGESLVDAVTHVFGASPCNLAAKLASAGRVEVIAGVSLPMLVRAFTYRTKGMETFVKKAVSGGCEGVLHLPPDPIYAAAPNRDH